MFFKRSFWYAVVLFPPLFLFFGVSATLTLTLLVTFGLCLLVKDRFLPSSQLAYASASLSNLLKLEEIALKEFCSSNDLCFSIVHEFKSVTVNEKVFEFALHCVVFTKKTHVTQEKEILVIHGVNSGPLFCINYLCDLLNNGYTVYAIALPGFGQSSFRCINSFLDCSPKEVLTFYVNFLKLFIEDKQLCNPVILGHSFGGFVASKFACTYPSLIGRLILVNSVGFLPTLENSGMYWAIVFKIGIPSCIFRPFGASLNRLFFFLKLSDDEERQKNVLRMLDIVQLSCCSNFGANIASLFISFNPFWAFWNYEVFMDVVSIKVQTDMIWGFRDNIIPVHCAKFVADCSKKNNNHNIRLFVMDGKHSPQDENILNFRFALMFALNNVEVHIKNSSNVSQVSREIFSYLCVEYGYSTLCLNETGRNIQEFYFQIRNKIFDKCNCEEQTTILAVKGERLFQLKSVKNQDDVHDLFTRMMNFFDS